MLQLRIKLYNKLTSLPQINIGNNIEKIQQNKGLITGKIADPFSGSFFFKNLLLPTTLSTTSLDITTIR
jgi:hypothetical protein